MDKTDRETRDFMNVESFSQLPFIRPAPSPPVKERGGAIRLFGKEFGSNATDDNSDSENINNDQETVLKDGSGSSSTDNNNTENNNASGRKFECHYCCRNFPTSQALGGHQNAHKRERQHAKRAHLQSAMVHAAADSHIYGLMNYNNNRYGSNPTTLPMAYHSWKNTSTYSTNTNNLYGGYGGYGSYNNAHHEPINGSPLGLWRIPQAAHSSLLSSSHVHNQIPVFNSLREDRTLLMKPSNNLSSSINGIISPSSQRGFGYHEYDQTKSSSKQDQVSLDLHL